MNEKKSRYLTEGTRGLVTIFQLTLIISLFLPFSFQAIAATKTDANILIYSTSHTDITYTKEKTGYIQVGITSFAPILRVTVDGLRRRLVFNSQAEFEIPYTLDKSRPLVIKLLVITQQGIGEKTFILHLGEKPPPPKPPLQFIALFSLVNTDNVNNESPEKQKDTATKTVLTFVPQYRLTWSVKNEWLLKGVILREKYTEQAFQGKETSFTQLVTEYQRTGTAWGDIAVGLGENDIRMNNKSLLRGENETSLETFYYLRALWKWKKGPRFTVTLENKKKDFKLAIRTLEDNQDSVAQTVKSQLSFKVYGIKTKLLGQYTRNEASISFHDSTSFRGNMTLSKAMGKWTSAWTYDYKKTDKYIVDTRVTGTGVQEKRESATNSIKLGYKFTPKTSLALLLKNKNQRSNVKDANYKNNSASLVLTLIF